MMEFGKLIDELGVIVEKRKEYEAQEKELKKEIGKVDLVIGSYSGHSYTMTVSERTDRVYSVAKTAKKLGRDFYRVVKVVAGELKKHISLTEMDRLVESSRPTKVYEFKKKQGG